MTSSNNILYLDLPNFQLSNTHLQLLRQAIEHSIQAQRSLDVYLNPATFIPRSIHNDSQWKAWQSILGTLYMTQVRLSYANDQPLFDMTVYPFLNKDMPQMEAQTEVFATTQDLPLLQTWNEKREALGLSRFETHVIDYHPPQQQVQPLDDKSTQSFQRDVVGGTFDHLHAGHKILLTMTVLLSTRDVVVGVTDDTMLQSKKHKEWLESVEQRIENVRSFCQRIRPDFNYTIVPIYDPYGPTITDPLIEALVCSVETLKGGEMVNVERDVRHYPPVALRVIDIISPDENQTRMEDKISSTWIRNYLATRS